MHRKILQMLYFFSKKSLRSFQFMDLWYVPSIIILQFTYLLKQVYLTLRSNNTFLNGKVRFAVRCIISLLPVCRRES